MEVDHAGRWPADIEMHFVDRCVEGTRLNKRRGRSWGKDGFHWLVTEMLKIGFRTSEKCIKQKWEYMKKQFHTWEALRLKYTGLGVHPETGHVEAPESFWDMACKENKSMKSFKKCAVDSGLYAKYFILFGGLSATGHHAWVPSPFGLFCNHDPQGVYRPSPPREGSGDSEDSQFGQDELHTPEVSARQVSPTAGTTGSGHKRTRGEEVTNPKKAGPTHIGEGSRSGRRGMGSMLSQSIDNMTSKLCSAVEARCLSSRQNGQEADVAEYNSIMGDVKSIPGWNEESHFHFFVMELMLDAKKKMLYKCLSTYSAKLLWLQHEWTKAFGQAPAL